MSWGSFEVHEDVGVYRRDRGVAVGSTPFARPNCRIYPVFLKEELGDLSYLGVEAAVGIEDHVLCFLPLIAAACSGQRCVAVVIEQLLKTEEFLF